MRESSSESFLIRKSKETTPMGPRAATNVCCPNTTVNSTRSHSPKWKVEMINCIVTLTAIPVPTARCLLMSGHPLRLCKLSHASPINYFCISESTLCLACNNNKDLHCVSWNDSPIWTHVEEALSHQVAGVLTNNPQPPFLAVPTLTQWACGQMSRGAWTEVILESMTSLHLGWPSSRHHSVQK